MTKLATKAALLVAIATAPVQAAAQDVDYDFAGAMESCMGFVPDVEMAWAMDHECLKAARTQCSWAQGGTDEWLCIARQTEWMRAHVSTHWPVVSAGTPYEGTAAPDAEMLGQMANEVLSGGVAELPDCRAIGVPSSREDAACDYSDALAGWIATRILVRLQNEPQEVRP